MNRAMLKNNTYKYTVLEELHILLGVQLVVHGELHSTKKIKTING